MPRIGDIVRYLNAVGGGRIVRIDGQMAYVDEDGFETPVLLRECVVVAHAGDQPSTNSFKPVREPSVQKASASAPTLPAPETPLPVVEVDGRDKLNVSIAFEPVDIKHLSDTSFDLYIVNDSNYYLFYVYLTCADGENWVARSHGTIEPNIQEIVTEVKRPDLARMDRIAVQLIAWKEGRDFDMKPALSVVPSAWDVTKLFKLHCFRPGVYFDSPVIELPLISEDIPASALVSNSKSAAADTARALEKALRSKKNADSRPSASQRTIVRNERNGVLEVDLHIDELVDTRAGLSSADMLNVQVDEFRRVMDANIRNHGRRIVFIHGKGEGVLRNALMKELRHRYRSCSVQDASFQEYGYGATQVTIQ